MEFTPGALAPRHTNPRQYNGEEKYLSNLFLAVIANTAKVLGGTLHRPSSALG